MIVGLYQGNKNGSLVTPVSLVKEKLFALGGFGRFGCSELFHQATLAAGGSILVNNAFFGSLVEGADGLEHIFLGSGSTLCQGGTGLIHSSTGSAAHITILDTTFLVLFVTFDLRLNVSQGISCLSS